MTTCLHFAVRSPLGPSVCTLPLQSGPLPANAAASLREKFREPQPDLSERTFFIFFAALAEGLREAAFAS